MSNQLQIIRDDIYSTRERFEKMSGGALNFEREAGFAVQIVAANDYVMRIAMDNRQSVINAVTNVGYRDQPEPGQASGVPRPP
jgi:recombination protein RecT